jgi:hypothetical protein
MLIRRRRNDVLSAKPGFDAVEMPFCRENRYSTEVKTAFSGPFSGITDWKQDSYGKNRRQTANRRGDEQKTTPLNRPPAPLQPAGKAGMMGNLGGQTPTRTVSTAS